MQLGLWVMVFNATFINISVISWRWVLLVEETRLPGENHRPAAITDKRYHIEICLRAIPTYKVMNKITTARSAYLYLREIDQSFNE